MAASLRGRAAVVGIGETAYERGADRSALALQLEASLRAVEDAGLEPKDIDGILPYASGAAVAEDFIANFGLEDVTFSATTPMGGASCVAAIQAAAVAVATGAGTATITSSSVTISRCTYMPPRTTTMATTMV